MDSRSPEHQDDVLTIEEKPSFMEGLKTEWNLFWETILGDEPEESESQATGAKTKDPFVTGKLESLTLEQIKAITKALSSDRRKLNQRLEKLRQEMDEYTMKLENHQLLGGEPAEAQAKINELSDLGQSISEQLDRINERLKMARQREGAIKKSPRD